MHHEGGIVSPSIWVDQQTRIAGEQSGRVKARRQSPRHARRADVIGDVALKGARRQAQIAVFGGKRVAGVVAQKQHAGLNLAGYGLDGGEIGNRVWSQVAHSHNLAARGRARQCAAAQKDCHVAASFARYRLFCALTRAPHAPINSPARLMR